MTNYVITGHSFKQEGFVWSKTKPIWADSPTGRTLLKKMWRHGRKVRFISFTYLKKWTDFTPKCITKTGLYVHTYKHEVIYLQNKCWNPAKFEIETSTNISNAKDTSGRLCVCVWGGVLDQKVCVLAGGWWGVLKLKGCRSGLWWYNEGVCTHTY